MAAINGRYEIQHQLGQGGQAAVFAVLDTREGGRRLALKTVDPAVQDALAIEFAELSALRHPALGRAYDLDVARGEDGPLAPGTPFMTCDWIDGEPLDDAADRVRADPQAVVLLAVRAGADILRALGFLHARGIVHGDVQPKNVLVRADGTAVLIDLGLARRAGARTEGAAGTLAYLPAEALFGEASAQTDLYGLGASLYRAVAGRAPHGETTETAELVRAILDGPIAPIEESAPHVSAALAKVVGRLIVPAPAGRWPSARAAAQGLADAAKEMGIADAGVPLLADPETREGRAAYVRSAGLVGRERELDRLVDALGAAIDGRAPSPIVFVRGACGVGRSRLLAEARRRMQLDAVARGESPPRWLYVSEDAREPAPGSGPTVLCASSLRRARALQADLVARTDEGTAIVAILDEDVAPPAGSAGVDLGPWTPAETSEWLAAVLCRRPAEALAKALFAATGGVPLFCEELLVRAAGDGGLDALDAQSLGRLALPGRAAQAIAQRLASLGPDERAALEALAVVREAPLSLLSAVEPRATAAVVARLCRAAMATVVSDGRIALGRASAAAIDVEPERSRSLHRAALTALDSSGDRDGSLVVARARHAAGAGDPRALALLGEAASWLEGHGELDAAIEALDRALHLSAADREREIGLRLVSLLRATGRYEEALSVLARPALSDDRVELAETLRMKGDPDAALAAFGAFGALGSEQAMTPRGRALRARIELDRGEPRRAIEIAGAIETDAPVLVEVVGLAHLRLGETARAEACFDKAARGATDDREAARALCLLGSVRHHRGESAAAAECYRQACERARHDPHGRAVYAANLAAALTDAGDYEGALFAYRESLAGLLRVGRPNEGAGVFFNYANLLLRLGDLAGARRAAERAAASGAGPELRGFCDLLRADLMREGDDLDGAEPAYREAQEALAKAGSARGQSFARVGRALVALARSDGAAALAVLDVPAPARGETDEAPADDARVLRTRAEALLACGSIQEAAEAARRSLVKARRRGQREEEAECEKLLSRVAHAAADPALEKKHDGEARRIFRRIAERVPERYRQDYLDRHAPAVATDPSGPAGATPGSPPDGLRPLTTPGAPAVQPTTDARWRRLAAIHKRLTSELRLGVLLELIVDTAVDLVQAERAFLLVANRNGDLEIRTARNFNRTDLEGEQLHLSRSIAEQVARGVEPVLAVDALADPRFVGARSVRDLRLHSVLAVPLRVRGESRGALYVDHRLRRGAFGAEDQEMMQDLADQAAIAIENVRLLAENRRARRRLELMAHKLEREVQTQKIELREMRRTLDDAGAATKYRYETLVGRSGAMADVLRVLDRVTDSAVPVVLEGESGTGKELIARAIHWNGPRRERPFVSENCGAIPETLLESALFGHVKGAFTGADRNKPGLFEVANQGTLFLDEVGEMSPAMQSKLLRVLQDGEFRPVGLAASRKVDVRVIAASNRDLARLVKEGRFREDLYYRLNVITVRVPPLRDRRADIPDLVEHFLTKHAPARKIRVERDAMARLVGYGWPGNVRQLENEIMRMVVLAGATVRAEHLSAEVSGASGESGTDEDLSLHEQVERLEKKLLVHAMREAQGSKSGAAKLLGLSRFGLQKKLKRYGME